MPAAIFNYGKDGLRLLALVNDHIARRNGLEVCWTELGPLLNEAFAMELRPQQWSSIIYNARRHFEPDREPTKYYSRRRRLKQPSGEKRLRGSQDLLRDTISDHVVQFAMNAASTALRRELSRVLKED